MSSQHISVPSEGPASPETGAGQGSVLPRDCTDFAPRAGGPPRASMSHSPRGHGDPRRRLPRALFQRHLLGELVRLALWRLERLSQPRTRPPAPGTPRGADDTATLVPHRYLLPPAATPPPALSPSKASPPPCTQTSPSAYRVPSTLSPGEPLFQARLDPQEKAPHPPHVAQGLGLLGKGPPGAQHT